MKCVSQQQILFCAKIQQMSNFQPLEVVGSGSETQLQVAENLNKLTWQEKG